ncbi:uncharacterized protein [Nicotiana tomentosiformis]|uniref:uncharacterized protein n=1 Tax=Nicotiana tomentosiformis TaxID=4098 RepID=UPI00388C62EA
MGIVEMSGVTFTIFQLSGAAYQWWRIYEEGSTADIASLTWTRFSELFLKEFVPHTLRDAWRTEFEQMRQGAMTVSEYAVRFSDLSRHAPALVSTIRERVCQFIEGRNYGIRFQHDSRVRDKYPISAGGRDFPKFGGGYVSHPVHSALLASSGALVILRSQVAHFAQPHSSAPPARGAFSGQSSRPGSSLSQQPYPLRACFEYGDTRHMVRDCPRIRRGAPPQTTQALRIQLGP